MILTIQCLSLKENKDAIVDKFRNVTNQRPKIDTENPGNVIKLHLYKQFVNVFLCLNIVSLHKRNYRQFQGQASLKKSLAACDTYQSKVVRRAKKNSNRY